MIGLTPEQILQLHALVLVKDCGAGGVRDVGRLDAAVCAQTQVVFGEELYSDIFSKAAAVIRSVVADHPFVDGNKRTAILAGLTVLELNNYHFDAISGELEDFAVRIATDHLSIAEIADWLRAHVNEKELQ